ncbi:hypothetical protein GCM10023186_03500 [Hymenobacter koreensis]|uniref:Uncharacterized protein n=1 Tax=Hymenobacter koreensis TaxID=1084523 RepID=A0ABP8IV58_9BACT
MHAVALLCQGFAQLGGYYARAAEGGVTDYTDVHMRGCGGLGGTGGLLPNSTTGGKLGKPANILRA